MIVFMYIAYRALAKFSVCVSKGVRADPTLHTALGSQCGHSGSGAPTADVQDSPAGAFAHAHHRRQHPTRHCVSTGR